MSSPIEIETPDDISRALLSRAREEAEILLIPRSLSRKRMSIFYEQNLNRLRHFSSEKELSKELGRVREMNGSTPTERVRYAVGKIFGGIAIGSSDYQMSISVAGNQSRFAVRDDSINQIVRISENEIRADTLGKYFDAYSGLPREQRPVFIIETHDDGSRIDSRIANVSDEFNFARFSPEKTLESHIVQRTPSKSLSELIDQYTNNSFSSPARLTVDELEDDIVLDRTLHEELAARLLHLRSLANERGKFATVDAAKALSVRLEELSQKPLSPNEQRIALATKVFSNLWMLYCMESPRDLFDNAMAIAKTLDDELMQSHCIRLINTVEKHGSMTDQLLHRAARTFFEHELYDFANFCLNNAYVGKFYSYEPIASEFADVTLASAESIDGFLGRTIMINNVGVAYLIEGNILAATDWFEKATKQPAAPIHTLGAQVNLAIARYLEGDDAECAELNRIARKAVRQLDPRYKYQIANMLLNLAVLAQRSSTSNDEIVDLLSSTGLLRDTVVTTDHTTLAYLANNLWPSAAVTSPGTGRRADFIARHGLVPIFHHAWL